MMAKINLVVSCLSFKREEMDVPCFLSNLGLSTRKVVVICFAYIGEWFKLVKEACWYLFEHELLYIWSATKMSLALRLLALIFAFSSSFPLLYLN